MAKSFEVLISGFHLFSCGDLESANPPMQIRPEQICKANSGVFDKDNVVASKGPNTPTEFMTAVSIAYAVLI